MKNPVSKEV